MGLGPIRALRANALPSDSSAPSVGPRGRSSGIRADRPWRRCQRTAIRMASGSQPGMVGSVRFLLRSSAGLDSRYWATPWVPARRRMSTIFSMTFSGVTSDKAQGDVARLVP